jgi:hypothetical protein
MSGPLFFWTITAEGFSRSLEQLRFPLHDGVGMNIEALREFGDGLIALDRSECHLGLEGRRVVAAGTIHDDLLLSRGFFAPQQQKSSHNGLFSYPRPPLNLVKFSTHGTLVSSTPLPYTAPWTLSGNTTITPNLINMVADSSGDIFLGDAGTQGVLRIDSKRRRDCVPDVLHVRSSRRRCQIEMAVRSQREIERIGRDALTLFDTFQALTPIDTTQW